MLVSGLNLTAQKRYFMGTLVVVIMITTSVSPVFAQMGGAFPQFPWGAGFKATLLEGAPFNDSFSLLFNPAAQRACLSPHISIEQVAPAGVPITALTWTSGGSWGGHLLARQTPKGLNFDYNTYQLGGTYAIQVKNLSLGWTQKLLVVSISGTETDYDDVALGYGVDLGLGYEMQIDWGVFKGFSLDFSCTDLLSKIRYGSGVAEKAASPIYRGVLTLKGKKLTLGVAGRFSSQSRNSLRVGAQYCFFQDKQLYAHVLENIALRVGAGLNEFSFGMGLKLKGFGVDYAYQAVAENSNEERAHHVSVSWRF